MTAHNANTADRGGRSALSATSSRKPGRLPGNWLGRRARGQTISDFEFNSVIISILIAFALSEILSSWSRLIKNRERVAAPWLYVAVSGWLFFSLILHWLGLSAYRELDFGVLLQSLLVFSPSIVGAAAAFVLTPELPAEGKIEIDEHYFAIAPFVFPLIAACVVLSGMSDLLVPGEAPTPLFVALAFGGLLLSLGFIRWRAMHRAVLALASTWTATGFLFGQV